MKKLSFLDKIVFIINSLIATYLLLSFLLPYISPKSMPVFAILSLFAPILLIVNIIFLIYWILKLKKQFLLSGSILLLGWFFSSPFYKFSKKEITEKSDIAIMSYNVRTFNQWKWINKEGVPKKIIEFVSDKNPDVVLFQEYYNLQEYKFNYPYKYIKTKNKTKKLGLAIYSKYPIINKGSFDFKETSNNIIYADILKNKDTIRIYNLHLESLQLKTDKENFGEESSEKLLARLKQRFKKQAEQTTVLLNHEKNWKGKKVIAGDFNNTAYSWVYKEISSNKQDAFLEAGGGFGKSYNFIFPMRIDFIFSDDRAIIDGFTTFDVNYSDHYPILSKISWK